MKRTLRDDERALLTWLGEQFLSPDDREKLARQLDVIQVEPIADAPNNAHFHASSPVGRLATARDTLDAWFFDDDGVSAYVLVGLASGVPAWLEMRRYSDASEPPRAIPAVDRLSIPLQARYDLTQKLRYAGEDAEMRRYDFSVADVVMSGTIIGTAPNPFDGAGGTIVLNGWWLRFARDLRVRAGNGGSFLRFAPGIAIPDDLLEPS